MEEFLREAALLQDQYVREIAEAEQRCARRLSHAAALGFLPYWTESRIWSLLQQECDEIDVRLGKEMEELDDLYNC